MTQKDKRKATEFASRFKSESKRFIAELSYLEGAKRQLEDDIECTKLYIKRICITHKLPLDIVDQFEKEMKQ